MADSNIDNDKQEDIKKSKLIDLFKTQLRKIQSFLIGIKDNAGIFFGKTNSRLQKISDIRDSLDKRIKIAIYIMLALIVVFIILIIIFLNKKEPLDVIYKPAEPIKITQSDNKTKLQSPKSDEWHNLAKKAVLLYNSGQISEALDIYNTLSIFSHSFSTFNLGVAKFRDNKYKDAISSFKDTIDSGENIAPSALNAAVSAYKLGDNKLFDSYIRLANETIVSWSLSPLYSYLYSLINYYSGNYFQTLSSLNHPTSSFYARENSLLLAKMYLAFNDDYNALKEMIKHPMIEDSYAIGLLYARLGDYDMAYSNINSYLSNNQSDAKALMAKALIEIKRSNFIQTANIYEDLLKTYSDKEIQKLYPIKITLHKSIFDVNAIQNNFWRIVDVQDNNIGHKILFYFAPFRVFDVDKAISIIQESGISFKINNLKEASNTLIQSRDISKVNLDIVRGLREIYNSNIYSALDIMQKASIKYPNHQTLQYNLGLIYAQLNDFDKAYKHFIKAYHLHNKDVLSGIFALMCSKLINKDTTRLLNEISLDFDHASLSPEEESFLRSLLGFVNGNLSSDMSWFNKDSKEVFKYALNALYSISSNNRDTILNAFLALKQASNDNVLSSMLYEIATHYRENIKLFSLKLLNFLKNDLKDITPVYSGPYIVREVYVYLSFLAGASHYVDNILSDRILNSKNNRIGILETLALNSIYTNEFEKAFTYYNALIDDYNLTNSNTYFFAALAAIGAGHYDNAVALMQLSRLESGINLDARFALALLYQSIGNFKLASLQFLQINDSKFKSRYFDFIIDTSSILELNKKSKNY